ncbi:MAG: hypothetical protein HY748_17280 [Elusimicrobia bacterium]|nr:hypothetical protein [Elusimicrobiota bacterium]
MKSLVYTNIGFEPTQYRMLKHIAVEEGRNLAELIRSLADHFIASFHARKQGGWERDFFFRIGNGWKLKKTGRRGRVNEHDRTIYSV